MLNDPGGEPLSNSFKDQLATAYDRSIHDDPLVRSYLAMAMGSTKDTTFGSILVNGLKDETLETRIAAMQALRHDPIQTCAVKPLGDLIQKTDTETERLSATISLGMIGDKSAIPSLERLLEDEQANIRWDAAIALAKMGEKSGAYIIEGLLDREYLNQFKQVDPIEQKGVDGSNKNSFYFV